MNNIPVPDIFFGEAYVRKADYSMEFITFLWNLSNHHGVQPRRSGQDVYLWPSKDRWSRLIYWGMKLRASLTSPFLFILEERDEQVCIHMCISHISLQGLGARINWEIPQAEMKWSNFKSVLTQCSWDSLWKNMLYKSTVLILSLCGTSSFVINTSRKVCWHFLHQLIDRF